MLTTSAPDFLLFKRFKEKWEYIYQDSYEDSSTDKDDLIQIIHTVLAKEKQPRDDYRELMKITLLVLGDNTQRQASFRAPGEAIITGVDSRGGMPPPILVTHYDFFFS